MMERREFLLGSAAAIAFGKAWAQSPDRAKLDRIAIMTLSFDSVIKSPAHPDDPNRTLDFMDAPDMIASHYGVHNVEVQHSQFMSTELPYLKEFRDRVRRANSHINQVCLEFGNLNISSPEPLLRLETIDLTKQWIDHAVDMGAPRVMVDQGSLAPETIQAAIETLKPIGEYGKSRKIFVTMENRGHGRAHAAAAPPPAGASPELPPWEVVVNIIKSAGIYANPDTGNFADEESRAIGLRALYPLSSGSSHVHYDPPRFSEVNAIKVSKEVGYKGLFSIEETPVNGPDPYVAVQTIVNELLRDI